MSWQLIWQYTPQLLQGTWLTIELVVLAVICGFVLSIIFTLCSISKFLIVRAPIATLVYFIRGTPLLAQIFIIYYGSGQFNALHQTWLWNFLKEPFFCALLALVINTASYSSVLFKGAIYSIPKGEVEACKALGMSRFLMLRRIILPRAIRIALPAYSNEVVMILKSSSLASTITLLDLMGMTRQIISSTYASIEFFLAAGVIYLLLNMLIIGIFRLLEKRLEIKA